MTAPVAPDDVLLGKYRVERVLGQGGMGVVVAARHLHLRELYALKFLLPKALSSAQTRERFMREARASARLRGEHVVRVHDIGQLDTGEPYMVMEYLDGRDLKAIVQNEGPLSFADAVLYMLQACEALGEAHAAGIIHRDIKSSNLFLTRRPNGTPCLKVLDFGISKQMASDEEELTKSSEGLGSPAYMSPEQMTRPRDVDVRSDIWSLGIVLYELLTGRTPFKAATRYEVVGRVLQEEPVPPSMLRADVPRALEGIVMRCLRKPIEERFRSVRELAAEFHKAKAEIDGLVQADGERAEARRVWSQPPASGVNTSDQSTLVMRRQAGASPDTTDEAYGELDTPTVSSWSQANPVSRSARRTKVATRVLMATPLVAVVVGVWVETWDMSGSAPVVIQQSTPQPVELPRPVPSPLPPPPPPAAPNPGSPNTSTGPVESSVPLPSATSKPLVDRPPQLVPSVLPKSKTLTVPRPKGTQKPHRPSLIDNDD